MVSLKNLRKQSNALFPQSTAYLELKRHTYSKFFNSGNRNSLHKYLVSELQVLKIYIAQYFKTDKLREVLVFKGEIVKQKHYDKTSQILENIIPKLL